MVSDTFLGLEITLFERRFLKSGNSISDDKGVAGLTILLSLVTMLIRDRFDCNDLCPYGR